MNSTLSISTVDSLPAPELPAVKKNAKRLFSAIRCFCIGLPAFALLGWQVQAAPTFTVGINGATANVNSWPMAEGPLNVRDSVTGTKYLNFLELDTGFIETFPALTLADGIMFSTANDALERDPMTFSLYGSTSTIVTGSESAGTTFDLGSFTVILQDQPITGFQTNPGRQVTVANQTFANTTAYRSYAVIFPTVRNSAAANSMQIGDVIFTNGGIAIAGQATNPVTGGAVPEPTSASLLALAAAGLLARRRRIA